MIKTFASCLFVVVLASGCGNKSEKKPDEPKKEEIKKEGKQDTPKPDDKPGDKPGDKKDDKMTGLASIKLPNANTSDEHVLSGGQPTDEHLQQAKDQGIKVVVNLRSEGEQAQYATEKQKVEELGMTYVHLPIDGKTGDGLTKDNAQKLADLYKDKANKPLLVHCASGQRVGALFALKAFYVDGADKDAALKAGRDHGLSNPGVEKLVTDVLAKGK